MNKLHLTKEGRTKQNLNLKSILTVKCVTKSEPCLHHEEAAWPSGLGAIFEIWRFLVQILHPTAIWICSR